VLGSPAEVALEAGYAAPACKVAALSGKWPLCPLPTVEAHALGGRNVVYFRVGRVHEAKCPGGRVLALRRINRPGKSVAQAIDEPHGARVLRMPAVETMGRTGELADRGGEGVRSCHSVTSRLPSSSAPASANAAT